MSNYPLYSKNALKANSVRLKAILGLAVILVLSLSGCALVDSAAGSGDKEGFIPKLLAPLQGAPGPLGLGASVITGLCGLWVAIRGRNWKKAACDGVSIFDQLKNSPEGKAIWESKIKPKVDAAKARKKFVELQAAIAEAKDILAQIKAAKEVK